MRSNAWTTCILASVASAGSGQVFAQLDSAQSYGGFEISGYGEVFGGDYGKLRVSFQDKSFSVSVEPVTTVGDYTSPPPNFDPFGNYGDYYGRDFRNEGMAISVREPPAIASTDIGRYDYEANCAICHGLNGTGPDREPRWNLLPTAIPNIATLAKRNGGMFPFERAYSVIDGRDETRARGPRDMPIWGEVFKNGSARLNSNYDQEGFARAKILALTEYVYRLQEK
jgi:hypothetical protein